MEVKVQKYKDSGGKVTTSGTNGDKEVKVTVKTKNEETFKDMATSLLTTNSNQLAIPMNNKKIE